MFQTDRMNTTRYNPQVDDFFARGCGRCALFETPQCRVHTWQEEMQTLRDILIDAGLTEERKWGNPCYTWNGKNVVMMGALKEYCSLGFFKGVLLKDPKKLLVAAGENSQAARQLRYTDVTEIARRKKDIAGLISEAIEIESSGKKVAFKATNEFAIPEELRDKFAEAPAFEKAFYALTPGRQRGYLLHFAEPKQSSTRKSRIEKYEEQIMRGVGLHDAYKKSK
jgi:uncharacterized protein YdeI (YjbR/CyaY-like superfamily)